MVEKTFGKIKLTIDQGDKGNDNVAVGTDRSHLMLTFRQLLLPYDSVLGYGLEAGTVSWFIAIAPRKSLQ
jgi:hypothetical protein